MFSCVTASRSRCIISLCIPSSCQIHFFRKPFIPASRLMVRNPVMLTRPQEVSQMVQIYLWEPLHVRLELDELPVSGGGAILTGLSCRGCSCSFLRPPDQPILHLQQHSAGISLSQESSVGSAYKALCSFALACIRHSMRDMC